MCLLILDILDFSIVQLDSEYRAIFHDFIFYCMFDPLFYYFALFHNYFRFSDVNLVNL